jgi:UDP-N-acetylmuramoylalanine-D-glutamate ligase
MDDEDLDEAKLTEAEQIIISPGIKLKHMLYQKYEAKIVSELNFL